MLVVLVAEVDELLLEGMLELLEGLDGLVLGRVRGREVDGLCGGLYMHLGELPSFTLRELGRELCLPPRGRGP